MAAVIGQLFAGERQRNIELVIWIRESEARRHDTNYGVAFFIEKNGASNDVAVGAKAGVPQAITEQRDIRGARTIFFSREGAAEHGPGLEDREDVGGEGLAFNALGFA